MSIVLVITGVSGSGKSAVGAALASRLGCTYYEADDFHPPANIKKMRQGHSLCDEDRQPWLAALRQTIEEELAADRSAVVSCSGLKKSYRQMLRVNINVKIISLEASRKLLESRLRQRTDHFFDPSLLDSQLQTWQVATDADLRVDASQSVDVIVDVITKKFTTH